MVFFTVTYSYDPDHYAVGPYETRAQAWNDMLSDAENEKQTEIDDGFEPVLSMDEDADEITLSTPSRTGGRDVISWRLFEGFRTV